MSDDEPVKFSISPEEMTSILAEAATKDRTVVEFSTRMNEDGQRELHRAMEITDHVTELESRLE